MQMHAVVDSKGRPLHFIVNGGWVHDCQAIADLLGTPEPQLAVTTDKAYDSEKLRQKIRDEGALPVIPSRSNANKKAIVQEASTVRATKPKPTSAVSRIGGASPPAMTARPKFPCRRSLRRKVLLNLVASPKP